MLIATALVLAVGAGTAVAARTGFLPLGDDCGGDTVLLRVAASPDIAPALRSVADRARAGHITSDWHCLDVRVSARTGFEMVSELARGGTPEFEVWLPDSTLWVDRAATGENVPVLEEAGNVASSPLTLATVPATAEKLGWPDKRYTWAEIAAATGEEPLRLGSADPARSATGLLALTEIKRSTTAEDGGGADLRTAEVAEALAERTAPGDSQVLATLPRDNSGAETGNPQRNQALILSEQAAHAHNTSDPAAPQLRLFYPEDGGTPLDYPYTMVDGGRLSTEENRAATRFQTLLGDARGRATLARHGFRLPDGKATDGVTRQAGGREPQPYTAATAEPPPSQSVRAALGMWTVTVQSARLTLAVDSSETMAAPVPGRGGQSRIDVTKEALAQGLSQFTQDDEIGLWEFATLLDGDRDYRELVPTARLGDRGPGGATQRERLAAAFARLRAVPGGATGLYDTTLAAYKEAQRTYTAGKFNALVLLTDGSNQDPGSVSRGALLKELRKLSDDRRPLPLIAVAVGPDADEEVCGQLARATGGSAHRIDDPAEIYSVILKAAMAAGTQR